MQSMSRKQIQKDIEDYIQDHGGDYSTWCVGVTANAKRRLFQVHKVDKTKGLYIRRRARSAEKAHEVEQHFLNKGCELATGTGDDGADRIYAYWVGAADKH
jgi:hypothetical protein